MPRHQEKDVNVNPAQFAEHARDVYCRILQEANPTPYDELSPAEQSAWEAVIRYMFACFDDYDPQEGELPNFEALKTPYHSGWRPPRLRGRFDDDDE